MKANELRIGNLLDYYGQTCIVLELLKNDYAEFGYFTDSVGFNRKLTEKHSPKSIPLTEEWLVKFGFTFDGTYYNKLDKASQNTFQLPTFPNKDGSIDISARISDTYLLELTEVYQLQNLYFTLTGEELIKT